VNELKCHVFVAVCKSNFDSSTSFLQSVRLIVNAGTGVRVADCVFRDVVGESCAGPKRVEGKASVSLCCLPVVASVL